MVIRVQDGFLWKEFEDVMEKIMSFDEQLDITWDLRALTRVPWEHLGKQINLMVGIQPNVKEHIKDTTILLPTQQWKKVLTAMFRVVPPTTPVKLKVERDAKQPLPKASKKRIRLRRSS